jgi:hypothetical protein
MMLAVAAYANWSVDPRVDLAHRAKSLMCRPGDQAVGGIIRVWDLLAAQSQRLMAARHCQERTWAKERKLEVEGYRLAETEEAKRCQMGRCGSGVQGPAEAKRAVLPTALHGFRALGFCSREVLERVDGVPAEDAAVRRQRKPGLVRKLTAKYKGKENKEQNGKLAEEEEASRALETAVGVRKCEDEDEGIKQEADVAGTEQVMATNWESWPAMMRVPTLMPTEVCEEARPGDTGMGRVWAWLEQTTDEPLVLGWSTQGRFFSRGHYPLLLMREYADVDDYLDDGSGTSDREKDSAEEGPPTEPPGGWVQRTR